MRFLRDGFLLIKPGEIRQQKPQKQPKPKKQYRGLTEKEMTSAQRRKVADIRQKLAESMRNGMQKLEILNGGRIEVTDNRTDHNERR